MNKSDVIRMVRSGDLPQCVRWITGQSRDGYPVGREVTQSSSYDWTDSPRYSGIRCEPREDNQSVRDWFLSELQWAPAEGLIVVVG